MTITKQQYDNGVLEIEEDSVDELMTELSEGTIEYFLEYEWTWEDIYELYLEKDDDGMYLDAVSDCDVNPDDHEEAFAGEYRDDEDFAYEFADSLGVIDPHVDWPYSCIDWERAARELMYDYSSSNGYYFRNL